MYKREIKLKSILDDKKLEFEIDIENAGNTFYITFEKFEKTSIWNTCGSINKILFTLNGNDVENLKMDIKNNYSDEGKKLMGLLLTNKDNLIIRQKYKDGQISGFYVDQISN